MLPKAEKAGRGAGAKSPEPTAAANFGAAGELTTLAPEDGDVVSVARKAGVPAGSDVPEPVARPVTGTSLTTPGLRTVVRRLVLSKDPGGLSGAFVVVRVFMFLAPILAQIEKEPALVQKEIFDADLRLACTAFLAMHAVEAQADKAEIIECTYYDERSAGGVSPAVSSILFARYQWQPRPDEVLQHQIRAPSGWLLRAALVHEAWLRLARQGDRKFADRKYFFCAAAVAMRRILIESARRKARLKRGGLLERVEFQEPGLADQAKAGIAGSG